MNNAWSLVASGMLMCGAGGASAEPAAGTEIVHPVDGTIMVYVPAGEFVMGLDRDEADGIAQDLGYRVADDLWAWEAYPKRTVTTEGYFIDKYEVAVERWQRFVTATGHKSGSTETSRHFNKPDELLLPAGEMKWEEAKQYAAWAGKALPSEAQWEKAARGPDGRFYPWGNEAPTPELGHFGKKGDGNRGQEKHLLYTQVGCYPGGASPYGVMDMLGNQYEWTSEWVKPYADNSEAARMAGYSEGLVCLRGGSWYHGWISFYASKRFGLKPDETYYHIGFRTVWTPPEDYFESAAYKKARGGVAERFRQMAAARALAVSVAKP